MELPRFGIRDDGHGEMIFCLDSAEWMEEWMAQEQASSIAVKVLHPQKGQLFTQRLLDNLHAIVQNEFRERITAGTIGLNPFNKKWDNLLYRFESKNKLNDRQLSLLARFEEGKNKATLSDRHEKHNGPLAPRKIEALKWAMRTDMHPDAAETVQALLDEYEKNNNV
jgi:hypothetical protein